MGNKRGWRNTHLFDRKGRNHELLVSLGWVYLGSEKRFYEVGGRWRDGWAHYYRKDKKGLVYTTRAAMREEGIDVS